MPEGSAFPEPLAERLTRENKKLRAEVERLRGPFPCCEHCTDDPEYHAENPRNSHDTSCLMCDRHAEAAEARLDALVADLRGLADDWDGRWSSTSWIDELRAVLDKHAGEQP